jgi:hypothetical protein
MEDYQCWNKHVEERLNETMMRVTYLEREVPTGVKEEHVDLNKADILGFADDNIKFQVHNIEEMVRLLLVPPWPQPTIKSSTHEVKACPRFLCNGRYMTLSASNSRHTKLKRVPDFFVMGDA